MQSLRKTKRATSARSDLTALQADNGVAASRENYTSPVHVAEHFTRRIVGKNRLALRSTPPKRQKSFGS
jgi:hypothetical protein